MRRQVILVLLFVFLLRLPFLNQAVQGDDFYYLAAAQHAQIDPLHPHHAQYVFLGIPIDMRGHPHPPGDAWILSALLALCGDIRELPFHLFYLLLSFAAALSTLALARRFAPEKALEATLLFCTVPAFVINGNTFESDLPFLAFWLLSTALTLAGRPAWAALALAACSLMAYQSVLLIPILGLWMWQQGTLKRHFWLLAIPPAVLCGYQLFERLTAGQFPLLILNQHFKNYGFQSSSNKWRSAVALSGHLAVMTTPLGLWALLKSRHRFLTPWVALFFAAACVLFFAGSARYLLPLAAPLAILAALYWSPLVLRALIAFQLLLGMSLAWVNYQHWQAYRVIAAEAMAGTEGRHVWVNGEWGLRFYTEALGALPVTQNLMLQPGDVLISSALATEIPYTTGGGQAVERLRRPITPTLPLRLIGLGVKSGYSSIGFGLRPFDLSTQPADIVTVSDIVASKPTRSWLPMADPKADAQIVSGVYTLENQEWRWMSARGVFLLKPPAAAAPIHAKIYIPDTAPGRTVTLLVNGNETARRTFSEPGVYTLEAPPALYSGDSITVQLAIDKDFQAPGDNRRLGLVLVALGFPEN